VGMAGAELVADLAIILGALVGVLDQQRDGRAGRDLLVHPLVLKDAGENLHRIGFLPLGDELALPRPPLVQERLDIRLGQRDARRAAVDDAAQRDPVAFAEGGDAEQMAEAVVAHQGPLARFGYRFKSRLRGFCTGLTLGSATFTIVLTSRWRNGPSW